jgi:hypothetical protein
MLTRKIQPKKSRFFALWLTELIDIKEDNSEKRLISKLRVVFFGMKSQI